MYRISAFYLFASQPEFASRREALLQLATEQGVRGSILLASEGVNGTIAGPEAGVQAVLDHIRAWDGFDALGWKNSYSEKMPFGRMKVRLKREIVTFGQETDPRNLVGRYVKPEDWNALISGNDVAVIDTRNDYEVAIGTFEKAIDPKTRSFTEFVQWWEENEEQLKGKKLAMFCTGGIRCEKTTSWLVGKGVPEVYHLEGGILKYLEEVPEEESRWQGGCFVFDDRVAVGHGLKPTGHKLCHGCRHPLSEGDEAHPDFEEGVSCPRCRPSASDAVLAGRRHRHSQILRGLLPQRG